MDNQSLIDMCTKKLDQDPYHRKALLLRASSLIKKNELEKALEDTQKLVYIDKENSTAFYLMGCIYEKLNLPEKSIENYNRAVEIDPNNVNALLSRGACYNKLGNYQKAIDDYSIALEKDSLRTDKKTLMKNIDRVLGLNKNVAKGQTDKSILSNNVNNSSNNNNSNILDNQAISNSILQKSGLNDLEGNELFDMNMNKINNYVYNQVNVPFNYKSILNSKNLESDVVKDDNFKQFQKNYNGNLGNLYSPEKDNYSYKYNYNNPESSDILKISNSNNPSKPNYNFDNTLFNNNNIQSNESSNNSQNYSLKPKQKIK